VKYHEFIYDIGKVLVDEEVRFFQYHTIAMSRGGDICDASHDQSVIH